MAWPKIAVAGYLTIGGQSDISITYQEGNIRLSGTYQITNTGNEKAQNVFPYLQIGKWSWAAEPRTIAPDTKQTWEIDSTFNIDLLSSQEVPGLNLPVKGKLPLLIRRHYEDLNGAKFSVADIIEILPVPLTQEELTAVRIPQLASSLFCEGDGQDFSCLLTIRNLTNSSKKILVDYHSSQELELPLKPEVIEIKGREQKLIESKIKNLSGLDGSSYAVFSFLQWEDAGIRQTSALSSIVKLHKVSSLPEFVGVTLISLAIAVLSFYIFIFKKK